MKLSIVIPCFNEQDNLNPLLDGIIATLESMGQDGEIVVVDDGSTDDSSLVLKERAAKDTRIKAVYLRRNFGQTAAMVAGMDHASGDIIIPMDADMQNDPADIPRLLAKLDEGYDLVSGWRKDRKDKAISRRLPSRLANALISKIGGVRLHDYGCTLKAYKRWVLDQINLYGEMHRFIPIYASWAGAKVAEIPVIHHPRTMGQSKYGINRTFKVLLDLITVKFLGSFSTKPIYFFGFIGMLLLTLGFLTGTGAIVHRFFSGPWVHRVPLLLLAVFLSLAGLQLMLIGLLAEIMTRTYHESQGKRIYLVREYANLSDLSSVIRPPSQPLDLPQPSAKGLCSPRSEMVEDQKEAAAVPDTTTAT